MPSIAETRFISSFPQYRNSMGTRNLDALPATELIATCRDGDHDAFDELRRRYSGVVLRTAFSLSGNWSEAEDIAQEAFIRMYRGVRSLKDAGMMPSWLYRVVRNVFIDRYRYHSRLPTLSLQTSLEGAEATLMVATDPSPEMCVIESERDALIQRAVSRLPEFLRRPLVLHYWQHKDYEEIARRLRVPVGTVKSRLFRGRVALRKSLNPQDCLFED